MVIFTSVGCTSYFSDQEERYRMELKPEEAVDEYADGLEDAIDDAVDDGEDPDAAEADFIAKTTFYLQNAGQGFGDIFGAVKADRDIKDRFEEQEIWALSAGGEVRLADWLVDFSASLTHSEEKEPNRLDTDFRNGDAHDFRFNYESEGGFAPRITQLGGSSLFEPGNFEFDEAVVENNIAEENEFALEFNVRRDMKFGQFPGYLKFGGKLRSREKRKDVEVQIFELADDIDYTLADAFEVVEDYPLAFASDGSYLRADAEKVRSTFEGNPNWFELDEKGTLEDSSVADYKSREKIYALYLMGNAKMNRWTVTAGARVEHTVFETEGFGTIFDEDGDLDDVVEISSDYTTSDLK